MNSKKLIKILSSQKIKLKTMRGFEIKVADTHNFYVVTSNGSTYLVHNTGGGGK
jgi:hypothetical protein